MLKLLLKHRASSSRCSSRRNFQKVGKESWHGGLAYVTATVFVAAKANAAVEIRKVQWRIYCFNQKTFLQMHWVPQLPRKRCHASRICDELRPISCEIVEFANFVVSRRIALNYFYSTIYHTILYISLSKTSTSLFSPGIIVLYKTASFSVKYFRVNISG